MRKKEPIATCVNCSIEVDPENAFTFEFNEEVYFFCDSHAQPFKMGLSLGQLELDSKLVSVLASLPEPIERQDIKKAIIQFIPMTKLGNFSANIESDYKFTTRFETPKQIYDELSKTVIGQDNAKKNVSVSIVNHISSIDNEDVPDHVDKHHVLLLGKSGSGKTLIAHTIAQMLNLPFVSGDATSYSPTGFYGQDSESVVYDLLVDTNMNFDLASRGVVFIDELDKICNTNKGNGRLESFTGSTQSTFLKLVEGKIAKVPGILFGDPPGSSYNLDTSQMLFFFGGAFNGLGEIVAKKMGKKERYMGFLQTDDMKNKNIDRALKDYEIFSEASREELVDSLIEYGMLSELVGRIPTIAPLKPLSKIDLMKVLTNSKSSPVMKQQAIFQKSGFNLVFTEEFLDQVVNLSHDSATGTRALDSYVKKAVSFASFDLLSTLKNKTVKGNVIINKDCIEKPESYNTFKLETKLSSKLAGN